MIWHICILCDSVQVLRTEAKGSTINYPGGGVVRIFANEFF